MPRLKQTVLRLRRDGPVIEVQIEPVLSRTIAFETNVAEGAIVGQDIECLIGRDILEQVVFTYDGPNSRFSISLK